MYMITCSIHMHLALRGENCLWLRDTGMNISSVHLFAKTHQQLVVFPTSLLTVLNYAALPCYSDLVQDSEGEDAAESRVTLAEDVGGGNLASRQSRVKLQEVCAQSSKTQT